MTREWRSVDGQSQIFTPPPLASRWTSISPATVRTQPVLPAAVPSTPPPDPPASTFPQQQLTRTSLKDEPDDARAPSAAEKDAEAEIKRWTGIRDQLRDAGEFAVAAESLAEKQLKESRGLRKQRREGKSAGQGGP